MRLGRIERLEQAIQLFRLKAAAAVLDADRDPGGSVVPVDTAADVEAPVPFVRAAHRVHGVHDEVQQHLLELHAVTEDERKVGWHVGSNRDTPGGRLGGRQRHDLVHQVREPDRDPLRRRSLCHGAHALDHGARSLGIAIDVGERRPQLVHVGAPVRQEGETRAGIVYDGRERLVHLVRDRRGQLSERGDARHVGERRLRLIQRLLCSLAFAQVDHRDEHALVARRLGRQHDGDERVDGFASDRRENDLLDAASVFGHRDQLGDPGRLHLARGQAGQGVEELLLARGTEQRDRSFVGVRDLDGSERLAREFGMLGQIAAEILHAARLQIAEPRHHFREVFLDDGDSHLLEDVSIALLALPQRLLRLASVVDVYTDAHPANDPPVGVADRQTVAELLGTEPVHRQHGARWIDHEVHRGVVFEDGPPLFVDLSQRFFAKTGLEPSTALAPSAGDQGKTDSGLHHSGSNFPKERA